MSVGYLRRWSDTGAPKLWANAYGGLVRLLEAVLVNGYGTQASLGWTKVYESSDTNTVVFRNNPTIGSGFYLQVSHSNAFGLATNYFSVAAYESMTDWNTGLSRCPTISIMAINQLGYNTGTICPDGIHWMIIGDDRGFWLCLRTYLTQYIDAISSNSGRLWKVMYFGDIIPFDAANQWPVFVTGGSSTSDISSIQYVSALGSINTGLWMMRDSTLEIGAVKVGIGIGTNYESQYIGNWIDFTPLYGAQAFTGVTVHDTNSKLMGFLPGYRAPLRKYGINGTASWFVYDEETLCGNSTIHTLLHEFSADASQARRLCLISGEGFRDVI